MKFVDGSIPVPNKDNPLHGAWERCNTLVVLWIMRSLSHSIVQNIIWIDYAKHLCKDLQDRFTQSDLAKISYKTKKISLKQGTNLITEYFT